MAGAGRYHRAMSVIADMRVGEMLAALAAKTPAPGGGAAAPVAGALAAAMAGMVVSYSIGKKDLVESQAMLAAAEQRLTRARGLLLELADEDARAYAIVNELQRLPETDARRVKEMPEAAAACTAAPMFVLIACVEISEIIAGLAGKSNKHLRSDLEIAAIVSEAAVRSAACNVRVNETLVTDEAKRAENRQRVSWAVARAGEMLKVVVG